MPRTVKTLTPTNATRPGRQPFVTALQAVQAGTQSTFNQVEPLFVQTMYAFDQLLAAGVATQGDWQNGKGDFFNDLLAQLLARCSGKDLHRRGRVPGVLFTNHSLDVAYPPSGTVLVTVETKAAGAPKHPGNQQQVPEGREGHKDLEKRIKEAAFKDIDIKGQHAASQGQGAGAPGATLQQWLRATPPRNWLFLAVRVRDDTDLRRTIEFATAASQWFDGCGLYAYGHQRWDLMKPYEAKRIPASLRLHGVLSNVCTALKNLP
jgi:hypothetical protein